MVSVGLLLLATAVAAATTSDRDWWQLHFSELGTHRDFSGTVFNLGSMSAGATFILFATRVRRAFADIRAQLDTVVHARRHASRLLVMLIASFGGHLAMVGLVPLDVNTAVHERAASGMMLSFLGILGLVLVSPWTVRRLRLTSVAVGAARPRSWCSPRAAITLAILEVVGFALIFVWLATFGATLRGAVAAPGTTTSSHAGRARPESDAAPREAPVASGASPSACVASSAERLLHRRGRGQSGACERGVLCGGAWGPQVLRRRRSRICGIRISGLPGRAALSCALDQVVEGRQHEQGQHGRGDEPADHHDRERLRDEAAVAGDAERHRGQREDRGQRGHQDRAEAPRAAVR